MNSTLFFQFVFLLFAAWCSAVTAYMVYRAPEHWAFLVMALSGIPIAVTHINVFVDYCRVKRRD